MDTRPAEAGDLRRWQENKLRIEAALADDGLRYFRLGRVLPVGHAAGNENNGQVATRLVCSGLMSPDTSIGG